MIVEDHRNGLVSVESRARKEPVVDSMPLPRRRFVGLAASAAFVPPLLGGAHKPSPNRQVPAPAPGWD